MRKLSELGISPAPWRIRVGDFDVVDANNEIVAEYQFVKPDIRLIAAAPAMYEAGYDIVIERCKKCAWCNRNPENKCDFTGKCSVKNLRAALAKAAGEEDAEARMKGEPNEQD